MSKPIRIDELAGSNWDTYTGSTDPAEQAFIVAQVDRISSFSPYFDAKLSWYPNARFYTDSYALFNPADNAIIAANPTWVLNDGGGNQLYINFNCSGGSCPQWAGNIADAGFRAHQIGILTSRASAGYIGIFLDDVNLTLDNVSDGSGTPVTPIDTSTGLPMTLSGWQGHWVTFLNQIRAAFPSLNIIHNSLWYLPNTAEIDSQIQAANFVNVERGFGDTGLTGGTGPFSVYALWNYIDHVHSLGTRVIIEDYSVANLEYSTAGHLMAWTSGDGLAFADMVPNPATWPTAFFNLPLGTPTGARVNISGGLWRRDYTNGVALFNEPGAATVTNYALGATYFDKVGTPYTQVTLTAKQGIILSGSAPAQVTCSIDISGVTLLCNDPPNGVVSIFYSHQLVVVGGKPPFTFRITAGSLPPGLALDPVAGIISGTPTTAGTFPFTVQVTDFIGSSASCAISIRVNEGTGNIYIIPPGTGPDDDYGQFEPYYTTCAIPTREQEMAYQLGSALKMIAYFTSSASWTGVLHVELFINTLDPQPYPTGGLWPITGAWQQTDNRVLDIEWSGGNAVGQRIFVRFSTTPTETDGPQGFIVTTLMAAMRPNVRQPVRGA